MGRWRWQRSRRAGVLIAVLVLVMLTACRDRPEGAAPVATATPVAAAPVTAPIAASLPTAPASVPTRGGTPAPPSSTAGTVPSFVLTETTVSQRLDALGVAIGETRDETQRWYQAPDRWRTETMDTYTPRTPASDQASRTAWTLVSDGATLWRAQGNDVQINRADARQDGVADLRYRNQYGQSATNLDSLLAAARSCSTPTVQGDESVAGRAAYVIDLGPTTCPSADGAQDNGKRRLWVDRETFFTLKDVTYATRDNQVIATREVTSVQYNAPIDPARFTYTPPPGAAIHDFRPQAAPTAEQYRQQLDALAKQADYPLFVLQDVPAGLVPRQPQFDPPVPGLQLAYVSPTEAGTNTPASQYGVEIAERKASASDVTDIPNQSEPVQVGAIAVWYSPGVRNADGTGGSANLTFVRDGVRIGLGSFVLGKDDLLRIAVSLAPVPGGHAPLPTPAPLTLAQIRQQMPFPIFVLSAVPAGLIPEPPVGGDQPQAMVRIDYHAADGTKALSILNGPVGCCLDGLSPKHDGEPLTLPNGIASHFLAGTPETGGPILWWQQEGTYLALSGSNETKDDLVTIAASLSKTADLGATQRPTARPTPTAIPAPPFTILRPAWLPEPLTVREQPILGSQPGTGAGVILGFDPHPDTLPSQALMTLRETPKAATLAVATPDPQAAHEMIGGHDVTIVRRGEEWVTLSWVQGDVALTLTNPARYTPDQLRQIVASV